MRVTDVIATAFEQELKDHLPALLSVRVRPRPADRIVTAAPAHHGHHHVPEPFIISSGLADGTLAIVDTSDGERFRLVIDKPTAELQATVVIRRDGGALETIELQPVPGAPRQLQSIIAPAEPHEFTAELELKVDGRSESLPFEMAEPHQH